MISCSSLPEAGVAQLVEQLIRNQQVIGSSPIAGSSFPQQIYNAAMQQRRRSAIVFQLRSMLYVQVVVTYVLFVYWRRRPLLGRPL